MSALDAIQSIGSRLADVVRVMFPSGPLKDAYQSGDKPEWLLWVQGCVPTAAFISVCIIGVLANLFLQTGSLMALTGVVVYPVILFGCSVAVGAYAQNSGEDFSSGVVMLAAAAAPIYITIGAAIGITLIGLALIWFLLKLPVTAPMWIGRVGARWMRARSIPRARALKGSSLVRRSDCVL